MYLSPKIITLNLDVYQIKIKQKIEDSKIIHLDCCLTLVITKINLHMT